MSFTPSTLSRARFAAEIIRKNYCLLTRKHCPQDHVIILNCYTTALDIRETSKKDMAEKHPQNNTNFPTFLVELSRSLDTELAAGPLK